TIAIVGSEPEGFAIDNLSFAVSTVTLLNVRASQQPGTTLVDIHYDMGGVIAPLFLSASVSTNGGATFNVLAGHVTGDGVSISVAAGTNYHIVWDAGVDLGPGYFPNVVLRLSAVGPSSNSGIFVVNLLGLSGGL